MKNINGINNTSDVCETSNGYPERDTEDGNGFILVYEFAHLWGNTDERFIHSALETY